MTHRHLALSLYSPCFLAVYTIVIFLPSFFCADCFVLFHFLSDHILPSASFHSCWPLPHSSSSVYPLHSSFFSAAIWKSHQCLSSFCLPFYTFFLCLFVHSSLSLHALAPHHGIFIFFRLVCVTGYFKVTRIDIFNSFISGSDSFLPPSNQQFLFVCVLYLLHFESQNMRFTRKEDILAGLHNFSVLIEG